MHILVGLGNPGDKYQQTRHNAGFLFAEFWRSQLGLPNWTMLKKAQALVTKNDTWMLIEPQQFMNQSGLAVRGVLDFYFQFGSLSAVQKASMLESVYVAHDDLDLVLGSIKLQFGKGPKVHNGLRSLYEHLGSTAFWHLRLGVDGRGDGERRPGRDYVLEDFLPAERKVLAAALTTSSKRLVEVSQKPPLLPKI